MMRRVFYAGVAVMLVGICALIVWGAPHCNTDDPPGPTIGHVIKLGGC